MAARALVAPRSHTSASGVSTATAMTIIGGSALYLCGNLLFKRLSAPYYPLSHLVGLGLLAVWTPAAAVVTPLVLSAGTTAILIIVAIWEWRSLRGRALAPAHS